MILTCLHHFDPQDAACASSNCPRCCSDPEPPRAQQVPQSAIGSIIGSGGSNINRIRQETGAKIKVFDEPVRNAPMQEIALEAVALTPGHYVTRAAILSAYRTSKHHNASLLMLRPYLLWLLDRERIASAVMRTDIMV